MILSKSKVKSQFLEFEEIEDISRSRAMSEINQISLKVKGGSQGLAAKLSELQANGGYSSGL